MAQQDCEAFVTKAAIDEPLAPHFEFMRQKTMYGGKTIDVGDVIYIFHSENAGGKGLIAKCSVTDTSPPPRLAGVERQTPRVNVKVTRLASAKRPLGRAELKSAAGEDGPAGELHFKFYRQATDKIGGISAAAARYLDSYF